MFLCSSQISPPSVPGLSALLALGLLQGDVNLATAVHQEILKIDLDGKYVNTVEKLTEYIEDLQVMVIFN